MARRSSGGSVKRNLLAIAVLVAGSMTAAAQNLNGAGATFPYPIYSKWFSEFAQANPGIKINYQSIGSGGGIRQVSEGTVDFGASDGPMNDEQIAAAKVKTMHIPTVLGAVVPVYNLPGVSTPLNFSGDVIADIYLGTISKWNDPRIAKDNPGVNLPAKAILPVYRSDGSGTTYIFTDYLSKVSSNWQSKVGKSTSVKWPTGIGQKGNEGVAGMVRQAPFSFGYVELIYAVQNKMEYGTVKNAAGKFVKASTDGVTAAAAAAAKSMPADYRVSITNAAGATSYPISSFTWLLIPTHSTDPSKAKALNAFLNWMLAHGESEAAAMTYAPLPKQVQDMVRKTIAQIK
ncbi:MAG: phosphate ABC transporter substrate-binding protein PstS [Acidobacteriota bacterium]|nr:phosphate ABC transporter substrate-binding protein PstS [Acidobacteriota bacterium]